ncbi:MAG TPA: Uma2 family endonuclease [Methylomirabilota bacterium]|nr:Uma2 family endonuclease [Methylomirabilota bacterium]
MARSGARTRRFSRLEYDRLIEAGFFRPDDRVELLGGQLVVAEPQGSHHYAALRAAHEALRALFGPGWEIRGQGPLALDDESEPEPDVAVVPGSFRDYREAHPSRPVLVIEIAESSLALDRHHKGSLYARAGLADYWIANPAERTLEVYRDPGPDPATRFGWRYRAVTVLARMGDGHAAGPAGPVGGRARSAGVIAPPVQGFAPWWDRKCARSDRSWSPSPASSCAIAPP